MNFPFFIAKRYLFNSKSNNVVNIISYISLFGVAIGTAALVVVLSVFNGLEDLILSKYNSFDPHLKVTSSVGKTFKIADLDSDLINNYNMKDKNNYWKKNISLISRCLLIWFTVSYVFGIILVDYLNLIRFGGYKVFKITSS